MKVGAAVVPLPYEKLRMIDDAFSKMFAESWNIEHGTDFKTQDEVFESLIKEGKEVTGRNIKLPAPGFEQ